MKRPKSPLLRVVRRWKAGPPAPAMGFGCGLDDEGPVRGLTPEQEAAILSSAPDTSIRDRFRPAQQGELPIGLEPSAPTDGEMRAALEQAVEEAHNQGYTTGVLAITDTGRWLVAGKDASPKAHEEAAVAAREKFGDVRIFLRSL